MPITTSRKDKLNMYIKNIDAKATVIKVRPCGQKQRDREQPIHITNIPSCEEEFLEHLNDGKYHHSYEEATPTKVTTTFVYHPDKYSIICITFVETDKPYDGEIRFSEPHTQARSYFDPKEVKTLINL